jgi:hypothetical protein
MMSDWFDEPDDEIDDDFYGEDSPDDNDFADMDNDGDWDDDEFEPEPPILNIDNPCSCCGGRGAYIDDLDPDKGYVRCEDCGGTGSAIDAMNKDHW